MIAAVLSKIKRAMTPTKVPTNTGTEIAAVDVLGAGTAVLVETDVDLSNSAPEEFTKVVVVLSAVIEFEVYMIVVSRVVVEGEVVGALDSTTKYY